MTDVAFDRTLALADQTFATIGTSDEYSVYDEYLRELDRVPVLRESVALPPPFPADFRQGQRPDARKRSRDDGEAHRESQTGELEHLYREYIDAAVTAPKTAKRPKSDRPKTAKRRKRRKR